MINYSDPCDGGGVFTDDKINQSVLITSSKIKQSDPLDVSGMIKDNQIRVIMANDIKQSGPCNADVVLKGNEINYFNSCDDVSVITNNEIIQMR